MVDDVVGNSDRHMPEVGWWELGIIKESFLKQLERRDGQRQKLLVGGLECVINTPPALKILIVHI